MTNSYFALDFGSTGVRVARLRPDISWINYDQCYQDPDIFGDVTQNSPTNVLHVVGDATRLGKTFGPESFDVVFHTGCCHIFLLIIQYQLNELLERYFMLQKLVA